jgi:hypothetical protein
MKWLLFIAGLISALLLGAILHNLGMLQADMWQRQVSPGPLSAVHASLANNCAGCHTPLKGVEPENCIACHATNAALLQRQPTAFHADIRTCSPCHLEHQGVNRRPTTMDHIALAKFGLTQLHADSAETNGWHEQLLGWIKRHREMKHQTIAAEELILDCASCHARQDRHIKLFGQECAECHATTQWTIAEFQHPSPRSTSCAQCHQPPPSHYMMHFEMVSKRVASPANAPGNHCCGDVQVNQCYRCHQTTSWNDIKGVGWYKHH